MAERDRQAPDPPHAPLPEDYADRDVEALRRARNQRRRVFRRKRSRERWLATLAELDPAAHAELLALRAVSAQAYRKRLVKLAKQHGFYSPFNDYGARELAPLAERRSEEGPPPPAPKVEDAPAPKKKKR